MSRIFEEELFSLGDLLCCDRERPNNAQTMGRFKITPDVSYFLFGLQYQ
jgi:hypothetical protein